jgi:hypothetical protein
LVEVSQICRQPGSEGNPAGPAHAYATKPIKPVQGFDKNQTMMRTNIDFIRFFTELDLNCTLSGSNRAKINNY